MKRMKKLIITTLLLALAVSCLAACGTAASSGQLAASGAGTGPASGAASTPATSGVAVRVGSLKGPTSIGLVHFMAQAKATPGEYANNYEFTVAGTADELVPRLVAGELDFALIPANLAATLYARTEGGIQVLNVNTLGVLSVVSGDETVLNLASLAGRTVFLTGKGTTPEYVMNYLLAQNGLTNTVQLEYKSEATEVAAALAANPQAVGVLPEPYVTALMAKNPQLAPRVSLTAEWEALSQSAAAAGQFVTGVTVVRTAFAAQNPTVVAEFLAAQAQSVAAVVANPAAAAGEVVAAGIIDNAAVAEDAIPRCNLVCLTGTACSKALDGYLAVLFASNPDSVGGALPGPNFYYQST